MNASSNGTFRIETSDGGINAVESSRNDAGSQESPSPSTEQYKLVFDQETTTWLLEPAKEGGGDTYPFMGCCDKIIQKNDEEKISLYCKDLDANGLEAFMAYLKGKAPFFEKLEIKYTEDSEEEVTEITACPARAVHVSCSTVKALKADFADDIYLKNCPQITDITCSQNTTIHFLANQHVPKTLDFSDVHVQGIALEICTAKMDDMNVREIIPPPKGITISVMRTKAGEDFINSLKPDQQQYFKLGDPPKGVTSQSAESENNQAVNAV